MDYRNYPYNPYQQPFSDKRSSNMEIAAMVCGIIALVGCSIIYISAIAGALAIIFALLSRGSERTCGVKANIGLGCGIGGLSISAVLYLMTFTILFASYGGVGNFFQEIGKYDLSSEADYEENYNALYDDIYSHLNDFLYPNHSNPR